MKKITLAAIATLTALAFAGTKMKIFYSNGTASTTALDAVDSIIFIEDSLNDTTVLDTSKAYNGRTVVLDNFQIHSGDTEHTTQNVLGNRLGKSFQTTEVSAGGGYWYAYASGNGAQVLGIDQNNSEFLIIDSAGVESINESMALSTSRDSLCITFDCRNVDGAGNWAGVGVSIAGDVGQKKEFPGALLVDAEDMFGGKKELLCWDFSSLESIEVDGEYLGNLRVNITGVTAEGLEGVASYIYSTFSDETELKSFYPEIEVKYLKPSDWMGAEWSAIKARVSSISIELDTQIDDYAEIRINSILLNFNNEQSALEAFPFLK